MTVSRCNPTATSSCHELWNIMKPWLVKETWIRKWSEFWLLFKRWKFVMKRTQQVRIPPVQLFHHHFFVLWILYCLSINSNKFGGKNSINSYYPLGLFLDSLMDKTPLYAFLTKKTTGRKVISRLFKETSAGPIKVAGLCQTKSRFKLND